MIQREKLLSAIATKVLASQSAFPDISKSDDDWHFTLAPLFLWGMGIERSSAIGPSTIRLDIDFKDALDNMDAVFTCHFEAQKQAWTPFAEYQFVDLSPSAKLPNGSKVNVDFENTMAELDVAYRVAQFANTDLEILGGARYFEQERSVKGIPIPPPSSLSTDDDWWDAIVGGRLRQRPGSV